MGAAKVNNLSARVGVKLALAGLFFIISSLQPALAAMGAGQGGAGGFDGGRAFEDLKRLVAFGPRPSGSKALEESRRWIIRQLEPLGWHVEEDSFVGATPRGPIPMSNVIARRPGAGRRIVILAGHYDTKRFDDFQFVGANDGGSSAAFLIEMARVMSRRKSSLAVWLVFFDGEEAVEQQWTATDSLYGSRHLVAKLSSSGDLGRVDAMILVDLIADARLDIHRESNSTPRLTELVFQTARRLNYSKYFPADERAIQDDHIPFVNAGVASVDLIDLNYGPKNSYWHSAQDTVEHCSPLSLTIVGRVVTATLEELEKQK